MFGNHALTAADAYRFARGEEVVSSSGLPARLKQPLDFLAVTDHAEFLGLYYRFEVDEQQLMDSELGKRWQSLQDTEAKHYTAFVDSIVDRNPERDAVPPKLAESIWLDVTRTADEFNDPGRFTAFSGYEWTAMTGGNNLHRCVIFRDSGDVVSQVLPFTAQQSIDPEDLWQALEQYEEATGGEVLAIPHNGNLSNGIMWDTETLAGKPLDAPYAKTRMRWEPIVEVTQIKGDSETHPLLSPNDEFAAFERWDKYNIMNSVETTPDMLPGSYARSALKLGMKLEKRLGVNPFKFGMIGSTDDHTSLATASEDNFFGKFADSEPGVRTPDTHMAGALVADWELGSSGLAAVWARENTREALFEAMENKEVYATTGSRIALRFFGAWDYEPGILSQSDFVARAYAKGVPMGSDLPRRSKGKAPTFIVYAQKGSEDPNLDRIQIIKGWLDRDGKQQEKIYDVAISDDRVVDPVTGKAPAVGSTVDVGTATYLNDIGSAQLSAEWTDPDFNARQPAFYYARVIEIPRPRWTVYDKKFFDTPLPDDAPTSIQDRAYSSPIWYNAKR